MNSADKRVVTHRDIDPVTWRNSQAIDRPLTAWVHDHVATTDIVVIGSESVVGALAQPTWSTNTACSPFPPPSDQGGTSSARVGSSNWSAPNGSAQRSVRPHHASSVIAMIRFLVTYDEPPTRPPSTSTTAPSMSR